MIDITHDDFASRLAILQDLFAGKIPAPKAAEQLATALLSENTSLEDRLDRLWTLILTIACSNPEHHDKLVDVLADLSALPDAKTPAETGKPEEPMTIHDMQIWKDLPMLGWKIRDYWNLSVPPESAGSKEKRQKAISTMININRFVALLVATDEPVFAGYDWFGLVTLREALETPWEDMGRDQPREAWVPAAAAWIEVLGVEMYEWDQEWEAGPLVGAKGKGGPLWDGKHGFCKGRWKLWRERFGDLARKEDEAPEVRRVATETEQMMKEIEAGDVE